jgi:60 kDa SS-A/Ro ribonucleoprotein
MTRLGTIKPLSNAENLVAQRLADERAIRKSRLHPFAILRALAVYGSGQGFRGIGRSWMRSTKPSTRHSSTFVQPASAT